MNGGNTTAELIDKHSAYGVRSTSDDGDGLGHIDTCLDNIDGLAKGKDADKSQHGGFGTINDPCTGDDNRINDQDNTSYRDALVGCDDTSNNGKTANG